jgi:hypothetical protein
MSPDDFAESADICFDLAIAGRSEIWPTNVGIKGTMPVVELAASDNFGFQEFIVLGCYDSDSPENSLALLVTSTHEGRVDEVDKVYIVNAMPDSSDDSTSFTRLGEITFLEHANVRWQSVTIALQAGSLQQQLQSLTVRSANAVSDNITSYHLPEDRMDGTYNAIDHRLQLPAPGGFTSQRIMHAIMQWKCESPLVETAHPGPSRSAAAYSMQLDGRRNYTARQGDDDHQRHLPDTQPELESDPKQGALPKHTDRGARTLTRSLHAKSSHDEYPSSSVAYGSIPANPKINSIKKSVSKYNIRVSVINTNR